MTDVRPVRSAEGEDSLQKSVRESLSSDTSFHHVLLSVAGEKKEFLILLSKITMQKNLIKESVVMF